MPGKDLPEKMIASRFQGNSLRTLLKMVCPGVALYSVMVAFPQLITFLPETMMER